MFRGEECIFFNGTINSMGYGVLKVGGRKGKLLSAHRISFRLFNGPIKKGREICHRCDNPKCINPNHLFMGTHEENMADFASKLRHPNSKFTPEEIVDIRRRYASGESSRRIASEFGVSHKTILYIKSKKGWKHVS